MPTPEQLGIVQIPAGTIATAWVTAHRRLHDLGTLCYHLDRLPQGYRFTCLLPTASQTRSHRIEAQARTEAEAVLLVLDKAEEWTRSAGTPASH